MGTNLSLQEMRYVIPQLLQNFQFNFASAEEGGSEEVEDVVEEFETFVTMRPKGGSLMVKISKPIHEKKIVKNIEEQQDGEEEKDSSKLALKCSS